MLTGQLNLVDDQIVGVLVTANYVPSYYHASLADVVPATRVATSGTLENRSVSSGVFGASDLRVDNVYGDPVKAIVLFKSTGVDITSSLIAYLDQSPDLPKNPNGGDLIFKWDTTSIKIFAI